MIGTGIAKEFLSIDRMADGHGRRRSLRRVNRSDIFPSSLSRNRRQRPLLESTAHHREWDGKGGIYAAAENC